MENMKGARNKNAIKAMNERRKAGTGEQSEAKKRTPKRKASSNK